MPVTTSPACMIALFDDIGSAVSPTANFTPATGYPLVNLRSPVLSERTRTPDLTADRQLTWDWGSSVEHNVFMLTASNATLSVAYRRRDADDSGFTSGVVESGGAILQTLFDTSLQSSTAIISPPWGKTLLSVYPVSVSKRYTRWHQSDTTNPDGYMSWGIARIGLGLQFEFDSSTTDDSVIVGTPGAERILRVKEVNFHSLTRAQASMLEDIARSRLSTGRMLLIPEPLAPETWIRDVIWCRLEGTVRKERIAYAKYPSGKAYRVVMRFVEVGY